MHDEPLTYNATPSDKEGVVILKLSGPLTLPNMFSLQNDLKSTESRVVILDLSGVPYMDSAGLGVILNYHVSSARKDRRLILAGTPPRVLSLLELTKVDKVLTLTGTVEDAEASV